LFARLDDSRPLASDTARFPDYNFEQDNRYLVGHRIDLRLWRNLRLGLYELNVFGGVGRSPELYYLNPLQLFHAAQLNEHKNDNTLLGADLIWLPRKGYSVHGQLLVDDYQIDNSAQSDQEPNEIAFVLGATRSGSVGTWLPDIEVEYTRIANRTYHQLHARNRYVYRGRPLGHSLGSDADSLALLCRFWPGRNQSLTVETAYARRGEGSLDGPWTEPWMETDGAYSEVFPSGTVESGYYLRLSAVGYVPLTRYTSDHLFATIDAGHGWLDNVGHIDGATETTWWLKATLSWQGLLDVDTNR